MTRSFCLVASNTVVAFSVLTKCCGDLHFLSCMFGVLYSSWHLIPQIREFSSGVLEFLHILLVGLDLIISFVSDPLPLPDILSLTWHSLQVSLSSSFLFAVLNFSLHVLIHFGFSLETHLIIRTCFHILNYVQYFIQPFVFSLYSLWSQPSPVSLFCQRCFFRQVSICNSFVWIYGHQGTCYTSNPSPSPFSF